MNIEIYENQTANVHITLQTEIPDFEVYGGTSKTQFTVSGEYTVEIPAQLVSGCSIPRYDIFARRKSNGREWPIITGKIFVNKRQSNVSGEAVSPKDYYVTIPIVESGVQGKTLVVGIPGDSAYDVARLNGFEGTESEWLESMRQQTATLAVEQVTPLTQRAETAADKSEREATAAKTEQETAAAHAAAAKKSEMAAAGHNTAAAEHMRDAEKAAQDALANKQDAEQAAQDASQAQAGAEQAKTEAQTSEQNAKVSANAAAADKTAAEKAKTDAQAAQTKAEQEAIKAEQAAADAQAPESIAAQAARPATMLLVRDELLSILGDASLFDLDTDGQKIIVHTDRLADEQLAEVTDMLGRFVPGFIAWEHENYMQMPYIMKKLPPLLNSALGGEGRHNLSYDNETVTVELAYPNLDKESKEAVQDILDYELPSRVTSTIKYGVTEHVVQHLLTDCEWELSNADNNYVSEIRRIFPDEKYTKGFVLPADMPFPEKLARKTNINGLFAKTPIIKLPNSWLFENAENVSAMFEAWWWNFNGSIGHPLVELPQGITFDKATHANFVFRFCQKLKELPESVTFARLQYARMAFMYSGLKKTPKGVSFNKVIDGDYMFANTAITEVDEAVNFASLKQAELMFDTCKLDKRSAIQVLNTIPTWTSGTHLLCLGIHVDHQTDEEVLEAIANAESKGWTLTVQWNGTPTSGVASTDLEEIWYRVTESEYGEYIDENGTRVSLDWGHYVTDESAYKLFFSLLEAEQYFKLTKIEQEELS